MMARQNTHTIDIRNVGKHYTQGKCVTQVLKHVDFAATSGEFVFLAGPSGSGKTTLLSILGAMLTPDSGQVRMLGCDVLALSHAARTQFRRDHIGFIFQRFHLIRGLNAEENVRVPLTLCGWPAPRIRDRTRELLSAVGMEDRASAMPPELSSGQRQRVAIARALAADPDLILADEPTASLDAAYGETVVQLLHTLTKASGKTAVVVTHDQRILPMGDRVCYIDDGRLRQSDANKNRLAASHEPVTIDMS